MSAARLSRWLVVLACLGCGEDGPAPAPIALEDFSAAMREAVCDWAVRCRHVPDRLTCSRLQDPKDFDVRRASDAIVDGRLSYDERLGGACIAETAEQACLALPFSARPCIEMLAGEVESGGACTSSFECASGATCEFDECGAQCCVGTCGEPAEPPSSPPRRGIGSSCTSHGDCVLTAYCDLGTCRALPDEEGESCTFGCAWGDLYCDIDALVCKGYASLGEPCDGEGVTLPPCDAAWAYCDDVCRARPTVGEPCDDAIRRCEPTAVCSSGECAARGGAKDPCQRSEDCEVACDEANGVCVPYETCEVGAPS